MRGLSLLLGVCGAVAALLGWQVLVGYLPPDPAGSSMAVRLGQGCVALLPGAAVLALMVLGQMALRFVAGIADPALHEAVDMAHLACASGVCPI